MTKLTAERLDKLQDNLLQFQDAYSDPADKENYDIFVDALHVLNEFKAAKEKLLAYEQAAKNPVAWVATDSEDFPEYNSHNEFSAGCGAGTPLYAAPVLPKQPERSRQNFESLCNQFWNWAEFDEINQDEEPRLEWNGSDYTHRVTAALWKMYQAAPAQPVIPEQPELVMKHSGVIAEQLAHVLSGMDVNAHQRAVISCAIDKLNKTAEILQQKPIVLIAPEKLDYQSAKELFNYLMNEEETNATVNGWNACRAEMLKAQPVSEPYKLPSGHALVPCKLTAENGAKSCMIGEFTEQTEISCPECFGDDECETCDGSGMIEVTVPVSWTTIKDIWAKGIEHFAAAPAQESE